MSSTPRWDSGASYGPRAATGVRRPPERTPFNPWFVAFVAYLIQTAVAMGVLFVLLMAGLVLGFASGLAGVGDNVTRSELFVVLILVIIGVLALSVVIQARYIRARGGVQPLLACVMAQVVGWLVAVPASLIEIPAVAFVAGTAFIEIAIVALLISPDSQSPRAS